MMSSVNRLRTTFRDQWGTDLEIPIELVISSREPNDNSLLAHIATAS